MKTLTLSQKLSMIRNVANYLTTDSGPVGQRTDMYLQDAMRAMIGMTENPEVFPLVLMSMLAQKMGYKPAYQTGYAEHELRMFERMWNDMLESDIDLTCSYEMNGYLNKLLR